MKKRTHAMSDRTGVKYSGEFQLRDGVSVRGELTLQEEQTLLELTAPEHFDAYSDSIRGVLSDRTRVSLLNCVTLGHGQNTRWDERYFTADIFPHLALFGDEHLTATDKRITHVYFIVDDATTVFHDYTSFGIVLKPENLIDSVVKANRDELRNYENEPTIGSYPQIFYFTGKREIFHVETVLGTLSASNNPSFTYPGPAGFHLQNRISIDVGLADPISADEAAERVLSVLRFIELVVGRPQNILDLRFRIESPAERPIVLDAYWCMVPKRRENADDRA